MQRSITIDWQDPAISSQAARNMNGLEFLQAIMAGQLPSPPFGMVLGTHKTQVEVGKVTFELDPGEHHCNPMGTVHGGAMCTLLDSAMGCSVHSTLQQGESFTTVEIKVNFVQSARPGEGPLVCEGKVVHVGGRLATAEGRVIDAKGRLLAHGTTTCMIFRPGKTDELA